MESQLLSFIIQTKKLKKLISGNTPFFMSDGDKEDRFYHLQLQSVCAIQCHFFAKFVALWFKRLLQGFMYQANFYRVGLGDWSPA